MSDLFQFFGIARNKPLETALGIAAMLLVLYLSHLVVKKILGRLVRFTSTPLPPFLRQLVTDDALYHRLSLFVPMLILYQGLPSIPHLTKGSIGFWRKIAIVGVIVIGISVFNFLTRKANQIYTSYEISRSRPIKGYLQVLVLLVAILGFLMVIATILDTSPMVFLSGLGALTAVIMLVFRDTILSLVAGVQLTTNDLIRVGDWIEMPQFNADGDVIDIALHVVRVQNWDKTITVIPAHRFLENSFKNWRGMQEAGGRRIKRSINIDMNTIGFLSETEIERFGRFALLKDYIKTKCEELAEHNRTNPLAATHIVNSRRLTNVGTFRTYIVNYLRQHPGIHQNMTFMVRQLQPTPEGLPLEIYVFVNDVAWTRYESVQADVFDHLLAMVGEFGLALYQRPSGRDLNGRHTVVDE